MDRHLGIEDGRIICRSCNEDVCGTEENYKLYALCDRKPMTEAGPLINDPAEYVDDDIEFRQFYCPDCGTLLENEVSKSDREPIHDKQLFET
jgi:acetone carboxylase gamma subunit